MNTMLLILTAGLSFFACITGSFGVAGMGSAKEKIRAWAIPLLIASLISAYLYSGWYAVIITATINLIIIAILIGIINKRHGGLASSRSIRQAQNYGPDEMIARMTNKNNKG